MSKILHRLSHREATHDPATHMDSYWNERELSTQRFFERIPRVDLHGRTLIDVGCGMGNTCIEAARRGAAEVLGVDVDLARIQFADAQLHKMPPKLASKVAFRHIEHLKDIENEHFDIVLSQDSFEHLDDPEDAVSDLQNLLSPTGVLIIGFGPPWGSPYGGHLQHVTNVPFAHLIFPERVVMHERMRFRPQERAHHYEDFRGGLNRMSIGRFDAIMAASGMECLSYRTNVSDNEIVRIMSFLARIPVARRLWRHLFTANVYGVWRKPGSTAAPVG